MRFWLLALIVAAAAIGCGGGSSSPIAAPTLQPRFSVKIQVGVPSSLLTTGVQSVVVAYIPVGEIVPPPVAPLTINVASGSQDCAAVGAKLECSGVIDVPLGQQNFTITLYSGPNGTGSQLGVKSLTATITSAGQTIDISNTNGTIQIIASLQLVIVPPQIVAGTASTFTVSVNAYDGSGRAVTSPFNVPVSIAIPPTPAAGAPVLIPPSFSPNVVLGLSGLAITATGPNQLFPFGYSGTLTNLPSAFTFSASAPGLAPVSAQLTVVLPTPPPTPTPSPTPTPVPTLPPLSTPSPGPVAVQPNIVFFTAANQPAQSFSASEPGVTTFAAASSNAAVATVSGSGSTFAVTPVGVGLAIITVTDNAGRTGTVDAYVNQSTVIISGRKRQP